VHSRYQRRLSDLAVAGRVVLPHLTGTEVLLRQRRLPSRTLAEPFPHLPDRYGRNTHAVDKALRMIGLALGDGPVRAWPAAWARPRRG